MHVFVLQASNGAGRQLNEFLASLPDDATVVGLYPFTEAATRSMCRAYGIPYEDASFDVRCLFDVPFAEGIARLAGPVLARVVQVHAFGSILDGGAEILRQAEQAGLPVTRHGYGTPDAAVLLALLAGEPLLRR